MRRAASKSQAVVSPNSPLADAPLPQSRNATPVATLENRYRKDLEASGGLIWSERVVEPMQLKGFPTMLKTIEGLPPGYRKPTYPRNLVTTASEWAPEKIADVRGTLRAQYNTAIAECNVEHALRCCLVKGLMLRDSLINRARSGLAVLHDCDAFPSLPVEMKVVLQSIDHGHSALDMALMGAVGATPSSIQILTGVELSMPIMGLASIKTIPNGTPSRRNRKVTLVTRDVPVCLVKATVPNASARFCEDPLGFARSLSSAFDDRLSPEDASRPLKCFEYHLMACHPVSEIDTTAERLRIQNIFGKRDSSRYMWLLGSNTDALQIPVSMLFRCVSEDATLVLSDSPGDIGTGARLPLPCSTRCNAARLRDRSRLRPFIAMEERAALQVITGVMGFDRMLRGADVAWFAADDCWSVIAGGSSSSVAAAGVATPPTPPHDDAESPAMSLEWSASLLLTPVPTADRCGGGETPLFRIVRCGLTLSPAPQPPRRRRTSYSNAAYPPYRR
jgi:hypothetical protein